MIDLECNIPGSVHFKWKEALYLPSWNAYHTPSEEEQQNIIKLASVMDKVREYLHTPLNIHCWIRPILNNEQSEHHGQDYNAFVKGATHSAHKIGLAVDYNGVSMSCYATKQILLPKLEEYGLRMEDNGDSANWVHNDVAPPNPNRYFKP